MWYTAALADGQSRYFHSLDAKVPRDLLFELLLEPYGSRGSISAAFFFFLNNGLSLFRANLWT